MRLPAEIWTVPLRFVTPAFVGGSTPDECAELRASAIRGALRAWYRLLVGPEVAAGLVPELWRLRESSLFGGTGPGEGQGVVLLSIEGLPPRGEMAWDTRSLRRPSPGLAYLGFSLDMGSNARKGLKPGTAFALRLVFPRGIDDERAQLLLSALWLWVSLGGLGTRSRRGFGSLTWHGEPRFVSPREEPLQKRALYLSKGRELREIKDEVGKGVDQAYRRANESRRGAREQARVTEAGLAYCLRLAKEDADHSRIVLWAGANRSGWPSASEAMDSFGRKFSEFRRRKGLDGLPSGALGMLTRKEPLSSAPRRTAFGLPLALRPVGQGGGAGFELLPLFVDPEVEKRAPSPLLVRICPMAERFIVILTLLGGPWPGRDVAVRERKAAHPIPPDPDNDLPQQFLDTLRPRAEVLP